MLHGGQIIIHAWGQKHVYEVRALPHEDYDALTLITCQGFDESSGEYGWRLAVRAVLIDVEGQ
ncbi:MAG: hypothetical protein H8D37_00110 [Chloroflexi bacterium]|nr:hypothetical protein [Chloroflexota bacterium]